MTKQLVEELLRIDVETDAAYAATVAKREEILREAREQALRYAQEAEGSFGHIREEAIRAHDGAMHRRKDEIIAMARAQADRVRIHASRKTAHAVKHLLQNLRNEEEAL